MPPQTAPRYRTALRRAGGVACALIGAATVLVTGLRLEILQGPSGGAGRVRGAELLYLPSGKSLAVASLGYRNLLADLVYLWAIQYYGRYDDENRYEYLDKVFREVITELDPNYIDPYWIGALIMTIEGKDLGMALRLLDKGIAANPDQWILPYLAGWECYYARQYDRAARYFEKAIEVPGAPPVIRRAYAGMFQKKGDPAAAIAAWTEVAGDPSMDERGRDIARRRLRDLTVDLHIEELTRAIERYRARFGTAPRALGALRAAGVLREIPTDPDGNMYRYDRRSGRVWHDPGLVLEHD